MKDNLSERKQKILKAVVDEYIKQAIPISSGEIKNKYFDNLSSATIRTELSTLEDMGYLMQPHTSAGRLPSPLAYKFYVKNFINKKPLRQKDIAKIEESFSAKFYEIEEIVKTAVKVISDVTNYTSVMVLKNINNVAIKEIKLVGLDSSTALIIIITDSGIIRDKLLVIENGLDEQYLRDATLLINKVFSGKKVGELKETKALMQKELDDFRDLINGVLTILSSYCEDCDTSIYMEGESKMLDHPEASLESARSFLSIIDNKNHIAELIGDSNDIEFSIKIGKDETGGMDKCAIVSAKYRVNGKEIGQAGVIGPERMDYSKVMSVLSYVGETLDTIINPKEKDD